MNSTLFTNSNIFSTSGFMTSAFGKRKLLSFVSIKLILVSALFAGTAVTSADAHAGRYHHNGYYKHGGYYHHGGHYYRHRHRHHRYRRHRDRDIAYLAGGLILGGIIVDAIHQNRHPHVVRERRVVTRDYDRPSISRHLHRDRYGNCYERMSNGDLIEVAPSMCAW